VWLYLIPQNKDNLKRPSFHKHGWH
jgi:hypothetical protein